MTSITKALPVIGVTRADIENWLRHQDLRTAYAPTIPGRARKLSRENVEELALVAAFSRVGVRLSGAIAAAREAMTRRDGGQLHEWAGVPADGEPLAWTGCLAVDGVEAITVGFVRVGEIFRRIDRVI